MQLRTTCVLLSLLTVLTALGDTAAQWPGRQSRQCALAARRRRLASQWAWRAADHGASRARWRAEQLLLAHRRRLNAEHNETLLPSNCPEGCTDSGVCDEEVGVCNCPRHLTGPACDQKIPDLAQQCINWGFKTVVLCTATHSGHCLNACNERGACVAGFCHCQQGFFGVDCALSINPADGQTELLRGYNYSVRALGPKIYVYELPGHFHMHKSVFRVDRPLHLLFTQRLLGAGVRTARADEADYFFIPVKLRMQGDGKLLLQAISYIRENWPHWNRLQGHRHLVLHTGDMGRIEMTNESLLVAENVTFLTHWGLHARQPRGQWDASHRPGRDVVLPIFIQPGLVDSYGMHTTPLHPVHRRPRNDSLQFFFAGRICGDRKQPLPGVWPNCDLLPENQLHGGYSAQTRQKVFYHHGNRTGYTVVTHTKTYAKDMASARFCLAPTGAGHGKRNVLVSMLGCVPVTVTDFVYQPFEPELNWSLFSVPLREADIPRLHQVLEDITEPQYQRLQEGLACAAQHLFWSSIYGSVMGEDGRFDAFETLMAILRARLRHPDVPPERLAALDPELDAFMRCQTPAADQSAADGGSSSQGDEGGGGAVEQPPLANASRPLCTHTPGDNGTPHCKNTRYAKGPLLIPGGAYCREAATLAQCTRVYP